MEALNLESRARPVFPKGQPANKDKGPARRAARGKGGNPDAEAKAKAKAVPKGKAKAKAKN